MKQKQTETRSQEEQLRQVKWFRVIERDTNTTPRAEQLRQVKWFSY
jgi:hypothetical protein